MVEECIDCSDRSGGCSVNPENLLRLTVRRTKCKAFSGVEYATEPPLLALERVVRLMPA
jgi:hypothetical protein